MRIYPGGYLFKDISNIWNLRSKEIAAAAADSRRRLFRFKIRSTKDEAAAAASSRLGTAERASERASQHGRVGTSRSSRLSVQPAGLTSAAASSSVQLTAILKLNAEKGPYKLSSSIYIQICLLYTSPSPRDRQKSRMPSSA